MEGGGNQVTLANTSLGIVFITFLIIVGDHILVLLFQDKTSTFLKVFHRNGQRAISVGDYLDDFDCDSHQLIDYTASKDNNESDHVSVTNSAKDSTY